MRNLLIFLGVLGASGCNIEAWDHCDDEDRDEDGHCCHHDHHHGDRPGSGGSGNGSGGRSGSGPSGGGTSSGGSASGQGGNLSSGGDPSSGGNTSSGGSGPGGAVSSGGAVGSGGSGAGPLPCDEERDCEQGFNCDFEQGICAPADFETCGELASEPACRVRVDCRTIYAGTNCSCGPDCECEGGEPGCICETFEFFRCAPVE